MVKIHLSRLLGERKWNQADLGRRTGIRPNTVSDLYNEFATTIRLEYLESICRTLNCDISDLLEIVPDEPNPDEVQNK